MNSEKSIRERTSLADRLRQRIRREGRITFRDWMQAALYDPHEGYYCRSGIKRWGRAGDYRTSPERSPLFAATFARHFARLYDALDCPSSWTIVECGAGVGYFAERLLETLQRRFPRVFSATTYIIDEASPSSCAAARGRLERFVERVEFHSLDNISAIASGLIFSNELLDAFPVHRVTMQGDELRELYVGLDQTGEFMWSVGPLSRARLADYFDLLEVQLIEGQIAEVNLAVEDWLANVGSRLCEGYLVTVDYGADATDLYQSPDRAPGTLRAFQHHQFADDVLAQPGRQDITTTVDWTFVRKVGAMLGFETIELEPQDRFLLREGLLDELESMAAGEDEAFKLQLRTGAREMILPSGMAGSFQVLVQKKSPAQKLFD